MTEHPPSTPSLRASASAGSDRVSLVVRDPDYALAFWEITAEGTRRSLDRLKHLAPRAELILRVHSVPEEAPVVPATRSYDIPLDAWIGSRFVLLGPSGLKHFCSIGYKTLDPGTGRGIFTAAARSEIVRTPRRNSTPGEVLWATS